MTQATEYFREATGMANPDAIVLASNFWDISRLWQLDPAWMRDTPVFPQDLMGSWRSNFTTIAQKFKVTRAHLHTSMLRQNSDYSKRAVDLTTASHAPHVLALTLS